jgi:hypothetical protein
MGLKNAVIFAAEVIYLLSSPKNLLAANPSLQHLYCA